MIKTRDEIVLLDTACMMVDAAYEELYRDDAPRNARERVRRDRQQGALRPRLRARRGRQRDLRRALLAASPRLLRPRAAPRRPGLLRHPALLHGLPHLLLPHVRGGQRVAGAGRRLQALPRHPRRGDREDPPGRDDRRGRLGLAEGAGVRLPQRGGGVRAAVRTRRRPLDLGEADHLAGWSRSTIPR